MKIWLFNTRKNTIKFLLELNIYQLLNIIKYYNYLFLLFLIFAINFKILYIISWFNII